MNTSDRDLELLGEGKKDKEIVKIYNSDEDFAEGTGSGIVIRDDKISLSGKTVTGQKFVRSYNKDVKDGVSAEVTLNTDRLGTEHQTVTYEICFDGQSSQEDQLPGDIDAAFATYKGNLYAFINKNLLWKEAKEFCEKNGGHLMTMLDQEENDVATKLVRAYGCNYTAFGFTDEGDEGNWRWVTGEPANYTNWNPGEPNNSFGRGQDFGYMYSSGKWDDGYRDNRTPFLCEWEHKDKLVPEEGRQIRLVVEVEGSVEAGQDWVCIEHEDGTTTAVYEAASLEEIRSCPLSLTIHPGQGEGYRSVIRDSYYTYYDIYGSGHQVSMGDLWLPTERVADSGTWSAVYDSGIEGTEWKNVCWEASHAGDSQIRVQVRAYDSDKREICETEVVNGTCLEQIRGRFIEIRMTMEKGQDDRSPSVEWIMAANDKAEPYIVQDKAPGSELICHPYMNQNSQMTAYCKVSGSTGFCGSATEWSLWKDGEELGEEVWQFTETSPFLISYSVKRPGTYELQVAVWYGTQRVTARKEIEVRPLSRLSPVKPLIEAEEINMVITGSAYDAEDMDYYTLEYRFEGADDYILFEKSTEPKHSEVLGHLDTTLLPNGTYEVRLSVVDAEGNQNRVIRKYVIEGGLKVGVMNLGFTDLVAGIGGLKVNVNRTYNSTNKNRGDFGFGWTLGVQGMTLSETNPLYTGYKLSVTGSWFAPGYSLNETKSHDIIVAYGDGTSDRFELTLSPDRQSIIPIQEVELGYRCVTNPNVKLEIDGNKKAMVQDTELLFDNMSMYSHVAYKLTTEEGVVIYLSAANGVTKLQDKFGNEIKVDNDGYHAAGGTGILFTRDSQGRIICAEDPDGNRTTYAYDAAGDLVKVTDRAGRKVTFTYDSDHNLVSITDPSGAAVSRNEYDSDGRLTAIIDADGNRTEYSYDLGGRSQVVKDRLGNSTVYVYDGDGNILQKTDANGHTTKHTYDPSGNMLSRTDAAGNTTRYGYDGNGNITSVTDAEGNELKSTYQDRNLITTMKSGDDEILIDYDEAGNIRETTDLAGNRTTYEHDKNGNVTGMADSIGKISSAKYDGNGNVVENTDSAGRRKTYTYDGDGKRLTQTEYIETENGTKERTTAYVYDAAGDLVQTVDAEGNATAIERNERGQMTAATDAQGRRTTYEYNGQGEVIRTAYADGTEESFTYDAEGRVTESVNRLGQKTGYVYDRVGNLLKSTDSRGNNTIYTYDENDRVLSVTEPSGAETTYTYDALGRGTSVTDASGHVTKFTYDKYSFLTETEDARGNVTKYVYNEAGNRVKTIYPDGSSIESGYDGRGRTIWQKNATGTKIEYTYDVADRLIQVENPAAGTTSYTYDKAGNLSAVEDADGNVTSYAYDEAGRLVKTTQPDGSTSTNAYDRYGRLEKSTDYNGVTTTVEYDVQDRVVREKTGSSVRTYEYDALGRVTKTATGDSTVRYSYTPYGELSEKNYENGQGVSYGYDRYGRKQSVAVKTGKKVLDRTTYEYDTLDRLTRVVAKDGTATVYEYDENGSRKAATFANGVRTTYEYDALNRLLVQKTVDSTGELIAQYQYTIGTNGERTGILEEGQSGKTETEYGYDGAGRLTKEKIVTTEEDGGKTETVYAYAYDAAGNRIWKTKEADGAASVTEYSYNSRNQLVSERTDGEQTVYSYDANGNLTGKAGPSASEEYRYDVYNRLISYVADHGTKQERYAYDAESVRRSKRSRAGEAETETVFLSDTSGELSRTLAETDGEGQLLASYGWGDALITQTREGKVSTYAYDGHGNVRGLLDGEGNQTDRYSYNAYGELTRKTGGTENHYLYTGEYYDGMSGLYYLRARYMNPGTGTFLSMDTYQGDMYEPVTLHKYLYANGNPVKYTDPSGMFSLPECNLSLAVGSVLQNQTAVMGLGILTGAGNAAITAACRGSAEEVTEAFGMGFLVGAGMGLFVCGIVVLNVITICEAGAFLAAAAISAGLADLVLLSVLTVYSVCTGNEQQLMTYVSLLMTAVMGTCMVYGAYGEVTVSGEKGSKTVTSEDVGKGGVGKQTYYHVTTKEAAESIKKSGQLESGKWEPGVYVWNRQPTREQAYLSGVGNRWLLSGRCVLRDEKVTVFGKEYKEGESVLEGWYLGEGIPGMDNKSARKQIAAALKISRSSLSVQDIVDKFHLTEGRLNAKIKNYDWEIWRVSAAIGYALGQKIFCFPAMDTCMLIEIVMKTGFFIYVEKLCREGCILLLPSSNREILEGITDEIIEFNNSILGWYWSKFHEIVSSYKAGNLFYQWAVDD